MLIVLCLFAGLVIFVYIVLVVCIDCNIFYLRCAWSNPRLLVLNTVNSCLRFACLVGLHRLANLLFM